MLIFYFSEAESILKILRLRLLVSLFK